MFQFLPYLAVVFYETLQKQSSFLQGTRPSRDLFPRPKVLGSSVYSYTLLPFVPCSILHFLLFRDRAQSLFQWTRILMLWSSTSLSLSFVLRSNWIRSGFALVCPFRPTNTRFVIEVQIFLFQSFSPSSFMLLVSCLLLQFPLPPHTLPRVISILSALSIFQISFLLLFCFLFFCFTRFTRFIFDGLILFHYILVSPASLLLRFLKSHPSPFSVSSLCFLFHFRCTRFERQSL